MNEQSKGKGRKKLLVALIAAVLLVIGIGVIVLPYAQQAIFDWQVEQDYKRFMTEISRDGLEDDAQNMPYAELYEKIQAYNKQLYAEGQAKLIDQASYEQPSFNLSEYGFAENIIGYIKIPKIDATLPIYLGASQANMEKGATHLSQTSLPIGGINTNSVICAHRNYYGAELFTRLPELTAGDEVIITNLWQTITYEVTTTNTIQANDVDSIKIQEDQDLLSLFTCYYSGDRKDRLVAYCQRVD